MATARAPATHDIPLCAKNPLSPSAEGMASHIVKSGGWIAEGTRRPLSRQVKGSEKPLPSTRKLAWAW